MAHSAPLEETSDDCGEDVYAILDFLNFKIVPRQPTDQDYRDDGDLFRLPQDNTGLDTDRKPFSDEIRKWRNYAELTERRMLEAEEKLIRCQNRSEKYYRELSSARKRALECWAQMEDLEKQVVTLKKNLGASETHNSDLYQKIRQQQESFDGDRGEWLKQKEILAKDLKKLSEIQEENRTLLATVSENHSKRIEMEINVGSLRTANSKLQSELESKVYYLKEVERIMEQQKQILRNSKEKHKKVKEEMQEVIIGLELSIATKDCEIERLTAELECKRLKT